MTNCYFTDSFESIIHEMLTDFNPKFAQLNDTKSNYPPYNILQSNDKSSYCIEVGVSGFSKDELSVNSVGGKLYISGKSNAKEMEKDDPRYMNYLVRKLANRNFELVFNLDEKIKICNVDLKNGILNINMNIEIPDEYKPKEYTIES